MSSAFRHLPMKKKFWKFLVMKATNPKDKKIYYFVDKCMPFGASISCANFQAFSDAIAHIVKTMTNKENINYLDDFFFAALRKIFVCDQQVSCFLEVCSTVRFPVAMEKTFWGSTRITFLGLLIDTYLQMIFIPIDKVQRAKDLITHLLNKPNNKTRLKTLQKLTGFLNFLGKSIIPGRAFTRRLYAYTKGVLKPHHHIYIKKEMKMDLRLWLEFLNHPSVYSRKFMDLSKKFTSEEISMFSDASANKDLGCGRIL